MVKHVYPFVLLGWVSVLPFQVPNEIQTLLWQLIGALISYYTLKILNRNKKEKI